MPAPSQRGSSGVQGASSGAAITVEGLKELRRELRALDKAGGERKWSRELGRTHRELGKWLAGLSQGVAGSMGGQQAHFAGMITGKGTVTGARIGVDPTAAGAFWGSKSRSGWNLDKYMAHLQAAARGEGELNGEWGRQFDPWVGNTWDVGEAGTGPYAINDTIAANDKVIVERYGRMLDRLMAEAFPD